MKTPFKKILGFVDNPEISIVQDKRETINLVLYITNILGVLAVASAIFEYSSMGIIGAGLVYFVFFSPFLFALFLKNKLSTNTLSYLIIVSGYLLSTYIMTNEAFYGVTVVLYVTIIVFATFLLGLKEGLITFSVCLLSIIIASVLFINGIFKVQSVILTSSNKWISWLAVGLTLTYLGIVLSLSLHRIQNKLHKTLKITKQKSNALNASNQELSKIKKHLEDLVKERTSEIETKNNELTASNVELKKLNEELERFNSLFVGREFRIKELRDKVKELEKRISESEGMD